MCIDYYSLTLFLIFYFLLLYSNNRLLVSSNKILYSSNRLLVIYLAQHTCMPMTLNGITNFQTALKSPDLTCEQIPIYNTNCVQNPLHKTYCADHYYKNKDFLAQQNNAHHVHLMSNLLHSHVSASCHPKNWMAHVIFIKSVGSGAVRIRFKRQILLPGLALKISWLNSCCGTLILTNLF